MCRANNSIVHTKWIKIRQARALVVVVGNLLGGFAESIIALKKLAVRLTSTQTLVVLEAGIVEVVGPIFRAILAQVEGGASLAVSEVAAVSVCRLENSHSDTGRNRRHNYSHNSSYP